VRPDFLVLVDRASQREAGKLSVEGLGITHVHVGELPVTIEELTAVARCFVEEVDLTATDPFRLLFRIVRPGGEVSGPDAGPLVIPAEELASHPFDSEEERAILIIVNLRGLRASAEGVHRLELLVNDEPFMARNFVIVVRENEAQPAASSSD
jgi:Family of unknown function (DUF6941)